MYTIFLILHLIGVAIGAGSAYMGDILFLVSAEDRVFSKDETHLMHTAGTVTWLGLLLLAISGLGLFAQDPATYLQSSKFITKMILVGIIALNGIALHHAHMPNIKKVIGIKIHTHKGFMKSSHLMQVSGAISVTAWTSVIILGALPSIPFSVLEALLIYTAILTLIIIFIRIIRKATLGF